MKKYTGWGKKGRPFSRTEFNNSTIKQRMGLSYDDYIKTYAKEHKKKSFRRLTY